MNNMLGYLRNYKRESVLAPLFKMLEATFDLFVPLVMADIVNVGIAAHDLHYILVRCGILLLLAVIGLTCSLTAQYFSAKAAVGYSTALHREALIATGVVLFVFILLINLCFSVLKGGKDHA